MNGVEPYAVATLFTDANWTVVGAGDLREDGKADLVWRHRNGGQTAVWIINGTGTTAERHDLRQCILALDAPGGRKW